MIHAKIVYTRIFPWGSSAAPSQIDRLQSITGDDTLGREKEHEIGRLTVLGYKQGTPTFNATLKQFEYGAMSFWYRLANLDTPASAGVDNSVDLDDLSTARFDIAGFQTDDDDVFKGTLWFPGLRVKGFNIDIANPDAIVERTFSLVGEDYILLATPSTGYYLGYEDGTKTGSGDLAIALSPVPVEYASGKYVVKVIRVRNGEATVLEEDVGAAVNTWSYNDGTKTVTIKTCIDGDICKVFYVSATAYTTPLWTNNNSDADFLNSEYCEIRMKVGSSERIYRLQTIGLDVSFDRADYKEIGNNDVVLTGIKEKTVTVSLDKYAEDCTLENILASDTAYPYINPREFSDDIQLQIKIFDDVAHTNFLIGYLITGLSPTTISANQPVNDYQKNTNKLESDNMKISDDETELAFS